MKRILALSFGLLIVVVVGVLLYFNMEIPRKWNYKNELLQYSWFEPTLYTLSTLLFVIACALIIFACKPSNKKRGLYLKYGDGTIYINKKSIEKNVLHTIAKYDGIRQPSATVILYQKKKASFIDIHVDLFIAEATTIQRLLTTMRTDIKKTTEHFSELPVRKVTINVLDQKILKKRVI
ncbi:alkaline shock response membrane anchor protein AmaP [Kurthia sibirica]|uniref:Alkaline shock response membrane anchor protein AmaP n=1 Tax=Kurthia sibirica TaxID=202750 RepID=A0A2U3APZ7_9BACL|nr:alkaline shock response membrane anchor protein AmaP [Kurthia sibirica]PWI26612.1 alkaline shock response membrane anchor protein AmaP [Kurthia sibirica]GEK32869.1 hypothetical protein KSI01_04020 [Kurthia sibirica]